MVNIKRTDKVIEKLIWLSQNLKLEQLKPFNTVYLIISLKVLSKLNQGFFESDEKVMRLLINFAQYYFQTIDDYQRGKKVAKPWQQLLESPKLPKLILLGIGANAHINNDLPLALHESVGESFNGDFIKLKSVVDMCMEDITQEFHLNKNPLRSFYIRIMILETKRWRQKAWDNFLKLKTNQITPFQIEHQATLIFPLNLLGRKKYT